MKNNQIVFPILLSFIVMIFLMVGCQQQENTVLGYRYKIHSSTGDKKPQVGDYVYFRLTITEESDSILNQMVKEPQLPVIKVPTEEELAQNPNPIGELLKRLSLNDSATVFMPIDSFKNMPVDLSQYDEIRYHIVLQRILTETEHQAEVAKQQQEKMEEITRNQAREPEVAEKLEELLADYKAGTLEVEKTDSGLEYVIIDQGDGQKPVDGDFVSVQYYGVLMDGTSFDNSYKRGEPITFTLGRREVIAGWDQGIALVNEGGSALLITPYTLAYGEAGSPPSIPAKSDLAFYVELENVF